MANTCKYYKQRKFVSYDSGSTWQPLNEYRKGDFYEADSTDCGYSVTYKWINVAGEYTCSGCTKYQKTQKYMSTDGGATWEAVTPAEYGIGSIIEQGSTDCGCSAQYRWVVVSGEYICIGTTKYIKEKKQVSYNNGVTWQDVVPSETRANGIIEEQSVDCGYIEPIYRWIDGEMCDDCENYKAINYTNSGTSINVQCNSSSTLDYSEITNRDSLSSSTIGICTNIIGDAAYSGCTNLDYVRIPSTVTSIGDYAFYNCQRLFDASIPDSVTSIGNYAFSGCTQLNRINLPNYLTYLGEGAFEYARNFSSINIPTTLTSIPNNCFKECDGLYKANISNSVTSIGNSAFYSCNSLPSINIPSGVTSIDGGAFYGCSSLTSVTFEQGSQLTSIGGSAFSNCSGLTSINLNRVEYIGRGAFYGCRSLTSIDIPSVIIIDRSAFIYCSSLTSVTIGSGVTTIGDYVFQDCNSLTSVTVNATTPPTLNYGSFDNTNNCPIYVPSQSVNAYKSASGWSDYADRIQAITI